MRCRRTESLGTFASTLASVDVDQCVFKATQIKSLAPCHARMLTTVVPPHHLIGDEERKPFEVSSKQRNCLRAWDKRFAQGYLPEINCRLGAKLD
ncbi:hypothetical protein EVAR_47181_1 [Eumeta japonica]|uniref:Uncharacterized protein n=1 Tax=Eumeta variegata TaxID=151549 RepID=A0A4C1WWX9_EUMVA|nr:hypothetical protein EVAR_47181_1 [Eumeta japonica]